MSDFDKIIDRTGTNSVKYDRRKEVFGTDQVLPMWVADMDFETPSFIRQALLERLQHPILGYSIRPEGFYQSFIDWSKKRYNLEVDRQWLTFSPGVVSALALSVLAYTEPGDAVIIQPPVYPPFFSTVKELDRRLVLNPLRRLSEGKYVMDLQDLEEKIVSSGAKLLFLSNPHNPVGRVWSEQELRDLAQLCLRHNVLIISDDIHSDFIYSNAKYTPLIGLEPDFAQNTVMALSPSKTFNIAGLTTSIVVIPNPQLREKYNEKLHGTHLFLGNIFGTVAFEAAYRHGEQWLDQLIQYLEGNVDLTVNFIRENIPQIKVWRPEGTFLLWLDFSPTGLEHEQIRHRLIHDARLGLNDGRDFGPKCGEKFFRMNIAAPRAIVRKALEQLKAAFS